ncbi:MAG: hypothetical protein LWW94_02085 [Candidatus Desulfofervidaceae bacterium]|nr:hypothetical protein [Candidatus Desulfofervidaceae bacterium]
MEKKDLLEISEEEWEREIDEEDLSLENILGGKSSPEKEALPWQDFQKKLKEFLQSRDKKLGEEVISQCEIISLNADKQVQLFLNILKNLIKGVLKIEDIFELIEAMTQNIPIVLSSENDPAQKEIFIKDFYQRYQKLKSASPYPSPAFTQRNEVLKKENLEAITQQIIEKLEGKLHEINIKIEENQRALHRLTVDVQPNLKVTETPLLQTETFPEIQESQQDFYLIEINKETFAIPADVVINVYKVSPKKAQKLAQKPIIKFGQLGGFFNSITKGLKGELSKKSKSELKNMFLSVLQPSEEISSEYKGVILVKVPDVGSYSVIFVDRLPYLKEKFKGNVRRDYLELPEGNFPILDIKNIWTRRQIEFGRVELF